MENTRYKVLLVEDDKVDQKAFEQLVKDKAISYDCVISDNVAQARDALQRDQFDAVITDYLLGDGTAFDILDSIRDTVAIIVTTGSGDEEIAVKAMKAGASDYLIKDPQRNYLKVLPITVENAIRHKKAEEKLKEYDRLKSEFMVGISHELRTPLCIFKSTISNVRANAFGKINPKLRERLETAEQSIDRVAKIISDFVDISQIDAGRMELLKSWFSIPRLVSEVVNSLTPLAAANNITLTTSLPDMDIVVNADRNRTAQVFRELISNGIKFIAQFIAQGGLITINVEDSGPDARVEVTDNGPGLKNEDLDKIFDRFVQIKKLVGPGEHGTGLGLPIAKGLIQLHGGWMWAVSNPGEGCIFCFTLPKYRGDADKQKQTCQAAKDDISKTADSQSPEKPMTIIGSGSGLSDL